MQRLVIFFSMFLFGFSALANDMVINNQSYNNSHYRQAPPPPVYGSGNIITENRTLNHFSNISISLSANIEIKTVPTDEIKVSLQGDDNILPLINTQLYQGALFISTQKHYLASNPVYITIELPDLTGVDLRGSGYVYLNDIEADKLFIRVGGSGVITGKGITNLLHTEMMGSGLIELSNLQSETAKVDLMGSGNINLHVTNTLNAKLMGSGNIFYKGTPENIASDVFGSGKLQPLKPM